MDKRKKSLIKENKKNNMTADIIMKASDTFKKNNWKIESDNIGWKDRFNRYCFMLNNLNNDQQELILKLTEDYLCISNADYIATLNLLLNELYFNNYYNITQYNKIYVMPLISPNDKILNKIKSSTYIAYLFMATELQYNNYLKNIKFYRVENKDNFPKNINSQPKSLIFLVDDFIGTGETAMDAINDLINYGIKKDKILVISLVAMKFGINMIKNNGLNVFSNKIISRGISDKYSGADLVKYSNIMSEIEKNMNINKKFNFGYNKSEALVTMSRTPNNTFPIFWHNENEREAPFPREG